MFYFTCPTKHKILLIGFFLNGIVFLEKVCATSSPNDKLTDEVQEDGVIRMSCLRTYKSIPLEIKERVPIRELYEKIRKYKVNSDICHGLSWVIIG